MRRACWGYERSAVPAWQAAGGSFVTGRNSGIAHSSNTWRTISPLSIPVQDGLPPLSNPATTNGASWSSSFWVNSGANAWSTIGLSGNNYLTNFPITMVAGGSLSLTADGTTMRIQNNSGPTVYATQTIPALPTNTWVPVSWAIYRRSVSLADVMFELNGSVLWAFNVAVANWSGITTLYYLSAGGTTWLLDDCAFGDSVTTDKPVEYVTCTRATLSAGSFNDWSLVGSASVASAVLSQDTQWIQSQARSNSKQSCAGVTPAPGTTEFFGANFFTRHRRATAENTACTVGVRLGGGTTEVTSARLLPTSTFIDVQSTLLYKADGSSISAAEAGSMQPLLRTVEPALIPPLPPNPSWHFDASRGSITFNGANQMIAWADTAGQTSVGIVGTINTEIGPGGYRVPIFVNGNTTYLTKPSQPGIRTVYALVRHNSLPFVTGWWGFQAGPPDGCQLTGLVGQFLYTSSQAPGFQTGCVVFQNQTQVLNPTTTAIPLNTWFLVCMRTSASVDPNAFFTDRTFNRNFDGRVALMLGYTAVHTDIDLAQVVYYCNQRFGLTL